MVATARIVLPTTTVRLSAGRTNMSDEGAYVSWPVQVLYLLEINSLTTPNPDIKKARSYLIY